MSNYPDNVDPRSPDCPWNQKDPVYVDCDECSGAGFYEVLDDGERYQEKCEFCDGTGQIEVDEEED